MNHDAAVACIERARRKWNEGNVDEAMRYTEKAQRLDPNINIPDFKFNGENEPTVRKRRDSSRTREDKQQSDDKTEKNFKKADVEAVRKIMVCKNLYALLGISKESSEDEIKRAYKSLARKYHPDKNKAPGATEAFKKIGSAFKVLIDPAKRQRYDQFGTVDEARPPVARQHYGDGAYTFDPNGGFDAEFINMFFNGGFPFSQNVRFQRQGPARRTRESDNENNYFAYIQILPLLILFGLSFFSNLFARDPVFSIQRNPKYSIERHTEAHSLPYYVKESFSQDYDGSLRQLEGQVLEHHISILRERCFRERSQKESMIYRARYTRDNTAYEYAKQMKTPNCDRVIQLYG